MKKIKKVLNKGRREMGGWILLIPSVLLLLLMVWQPLMATIKISFYETKGFEAVRFVGFENFKNVLTNSSFLTTLKNTCFYVIWSLIIGFLLPYVTAVMVNEMVHAKSVFRFFCYFPAMVPGMAAALMWRFLFEPGKNGVLNAILGIFGINPCQWLQDPKLVIPLIVITMTWRGFGGSMLIYLASLQGINRDLYEAASIDGAGFFQKMRYIQLPAVKGLLMLMLIRQIISVFQVMQEPLAMTAGGPNNASSTLMLSSYNYAFTYFELGRAMAVGTITFLILAVLTVIYQIISRKVED